MSFMGGPECSTAGNPLSQFAKHTQDDRSLQRDRMVNGGPQGAMGGFRSAGQHAPQDEMVNGFMQQNGQLPNMPLENMNQIRLDPPGQGVHLRGNSASPAWASEFQSTPQAAMEAAFKAPPGTQFGPEDFAKFQQMNQANSSRSSPMPSTMGGYQRPMMGMGRMNSMGMGYGMGGMYNSPMYHPAQHQQPPLDAMDQGKGKGKLVELDDKQWEEQFKQLELQDAQAAEQDEAQALEPELNKMDEKILESETNQFGDFESIWKGIQAEKAASKEALDEEEWIEQLDGQDWSNGMNWDGLTSRGLVGDPIIEDYLFEEDNLFKDTANPFDEGMRIVEEGGNLSLAALAFEAAVQKDPTHVEAWVQLGNSQAQNEKETPAIRALEQARKLDPNNAPALMTLAVSYTNEGYDSTAYRTLERWLSIRYPAIVPPADVSAVADMGFTERHQLHEKVTQLFINAARLSPDGEHMDPDVQVGLGVLFYGAEEYDKAVDCFSAALASSEQGASNRQSQVHLLWNRLGATLANSGKSEDAIAAYEKALTLRPNFVRARYNLGVSCINMGCHEEAAGHLLAALGMHKSVEREGRERARELLSGGNGGVSDAQLDALVSHNQSTNLYDTLRRVFTQMGRRDLAEKVVAGVDPEVFRGEIEF